ncbi:MAG: glycosyltransferase family 4 protein [bacterium]|nr:glycosyltransferase family 4 protein [bacterium]
MLKRLLIITQKVDKDDAVLGFFHRWLEEFAKHLEKVEVLCLYEGTHALPKNVSVYSLGKEKGYSKIRQLFRFWKFCFALTRKIDGVFVHMNAIYVLLGWVFWKMRGVNIFLWRNHPEGGWLARLAYVLAHRIFYTSPHAHAARFPRAQRMPAGIDTDFFRKDERVSRTPNSILFLGRISPVKHIEIVLEAAKLLDAGGSSFTLSVVGSAPKADDVYEAKIHELALPLFKKGIVKFVPAVRNTDTPHIYNAHEIFINATPTGSYDKTILEAMACGTIPLVCNRSFAEILSKDLVFSEGDTHDLAQKLIMALRLSEDRRQDIRRRLRDYVDTRHGIERLVYNVCAQYEIL